MSKRHGRKSNKKDETNFHLNLTHPLVIVLREVAKHVPKGNLICFIYLLEDFHLVLGEKDLTYIRRGVEKFSFKDFDDEELFFALIPAVFCQLENFVLDEEEYSDSNDKPLSPEVADTYARLALITLRLKEHADEIINSADVPDLALISTEVLIDFIDMFATEILMSIPSIVGMEVE